MAVSRLGNVRVGCENERGLVLCDSIENDGDTSMCPSQRHANVARTLTQIDIRTYFLLVLQHDRVGVRPDVVKYLLGCDAVPHR